MARLTQNDLMKRTTDIAWTHHTVNFWWGCTKVPPACTHCYAENLGKFFGPKLFGQPVLWGAGKPRFERLDAARAECLKLQRQAHESGKPILVFVNSMSDWLDDEVPIEWLAYLLETLHRCPNVRFQLLTKRPENWKQRVSSVLIRQASNPEYSDAYNWISDWEMADSPPRNLWIGTTVENQDYANKRIPHLLEIPAKVRFLSCEPLLGPVKLLDIETGWPFYDLSGQEQLHWVIAGGESGGSSRPTHPDWFRSLRVDCAAVRTPFFFKQWGDYVEAGPNAEHLPTTKTYKADTSLGVTMLKAMATLAGNTLDGVKHEAFPQL